MARLAIGKLTPWLLALSLVLLAYAHYRVWFLRQGHRTARFILILNTALVGLLWYDRVRTWLLP